MKRFIASIMILGVAGLMGGADLVSAGTLDDVKIGLTVKTFAAFGKCTTNAPSGLACDAPNSTSALVTNWPINTAFNMYVVALDIDPAVGLGGAAFGIAYGPNVFVEWLVCASQEFAGQGWPASGGGNTITYAPAACPVGPDPSDPQGDATRVLGVFSGVAYTDNLFEITQRQVAIPDFNVADCAATQSSPAFPLFAGKVGFGTVAGYQPCVQEEVPVEATTWGAIKKGLE